jgi:predicted PurR-regulated permease PerM
LQSSTASAPGGISIAVLATMLPVSQPGVATAAAPARDNVTRAAAVTVLAVAAFAVAAWAKPVLMPLALALLLHLALAPLVRGLKRAGVPTYCGALLVVGAGIAAIATMAFQLAGPVQEWIYRLPAAFARIEERVRTLMEPVRRIAKASESVQKFTADDPTNALKVSVLDPSTNTILIARTGEMIGLAAMTALLLYFLLASDGGFLRRIVRVLPTLSDKKRAVETARGLEQEVGRYFSMFFAISVGLGITEGSAMAVLGMPNPVLWGLMATLLCWIPYAGALAGTAIVALAASLAFDDTWRALLTPGVFYSLTVVEGSLVTPLIMGRRLTLNPVIVLVWVALWSWMWGVVGAFIALPMLAALRIVAIKSQSMSALGEILSARDTPSVDATPVDSRLDVGLGSEQT